MTTRIGQFLGLCCEIKDDSLRTVEKTTGVSNAVISQIESGRIKDPSFSSVVKLCAHYGVRLERVAATIEQQEKPRG